MKKLLMSIAALLLSATLFAATSAKELCAGVYDFATKPSAAWKIYDGNFTTIDVVNEEYVFTGGFSVKILIGYSRYDFKCTVTNSDDDFNVELSDVESYACDKNGKMLGTATTMKTSASVSKQYAEQMKTEIKNRIDAFQKSGKFEEEYTKIVTTPAFVNVMCKSMSELAVKKFVETELNDKDVSFDVTLKSVNENLNPVTGKVDEYAYKAVGSIELYADGKPGVLVITKPYSIYIYSNNDKLLSAKIGSTYTVKGKANMKWYSSGLDKYWFYNVYED